MVDLSVSHQAEARDLWASLTRLFFARLTVALQTPTLDPTNPFYYHATTHPIFDTQQQYRSFADFVRSFLHPSELQRLVAVAVTALTPAGGETSSFLDTTGGIRVPL